jgi:hypothetical protein
MMHKHRLVAFLATLGGIVVLSLASALAILLSDRTDEKVVAALGFIASAVTGLIGLIGTFRPQQNHTGEGD